MDLDRSSIYPFICILNEWLQFNWRTEKSCYFVGYLIWYTVVTIYHTYKIKILVDFICFNSPLPKGITTMRINDYFSQTILLAFCLIWLLSVHFQNNLAEKSLYKRYIYISFLQDDRRRYDEPRETTTF